MEVKGFKVGWLATNCYIVSDEESRDAAIIDPGFENEKEAKPILDYIRSNNLKLNYIINTHGHPDHISGNMIMKKATGASILIHENHKGQANADQKLHEGDSIQIGNYKLVVLYTPGHTKSGISLLGDNMVFTGDTLFAGSIGRTDFPGGSFHEIIDSIKTKLMSLPESFKVYPGHESYSTIGKEKKYNPFLQN